MKIPSFRRQRGFTLVELLIVIAIIAVLAAAGFAGARTAIEKAKKMTALTTCTGIEAAVNSFFTEYGTLPTLDTTEGELDSPPLNTKDDKEFLNILLGLETGETPLNPRSVKFPSFKEGKQVGRADGKDGLVYEDDQKTVRGLFDPWGYPYFVQLDTGFDERLEVKPEGSAVSKILNRRVAAWSNGADWKNENKSMDDVTTWSK